MILQTRPRYFFMANTMVLFSYPYYVFSPLSLNRDTFNRRILMYLFIRASI